MKPIEAKIKKWSRAEALAGLAPHLPAGKREAVLAEVLAAVWGIEDEWRQAGRGSPAPLATLDSTPPLG